MRSYRIYTVSFVLVLALLLCACQQGSSVSKDAASAQTLTKRMSSQTPVAQSTATSAVSTDVPVKLLIPSITVSAPVEAVGTLASGDMETPTQNPWIDTGWYSAGPQPGERGSAVIDGHLDRPGGAPAVFWSLGSMHAGDSVMVVMSSGRTLHFLVTRLAYYAPTDAPLQEIFGDHSGVYLNLITCAGDWIPSQHQTTLRLVVYTSLAQG